MATRRRIDWPILVEPGAPVPKWSSDPAPSETVSLLVAFEELFSIEDTDAMLKRAVQLALDPVGLVRAGLYVYDPKLDLMLGTWGTGLEGQVVDEHRVMFELGEQGRRVFERAASGEALWTVVENCPLIVHDEQETRVVGRGWVTCTPIRSARGPVGMLYNDPGLTNAVVEPEKQARAAILCSLVGALLDATIRHPIRIASPTTTAQRHPAVVQAVRMLGKDCSLGGQALAAQVGISLSRLARIFKAEMGLSLVEYRNRLRLQRFSVFVNAGRTNLLEAALGAGFGSYAQFHRVFRALHGRTPREYLPARDRSTSLPRAKKTRAAPRRRK